MNVLIVDDHPLVQIVMKAVVESAFNGCSVMPAENLSDAIVIAGSGPKPALALLDLALPDSSGIKTLIRFRAAQPAVPAVVMSADAAGETILQALEAGAVSYLPKTLTPDAMISALRLIVSGVPYLPPQTMAKQPGRREGSLTTRQRQILDLIADGHDNHAIAKQLRISYGTVRQHVHALYNTLGVSSRTQAVIAAVRGLVVPGARREYAEPLEIRRWPPSLGAAERLSDAAEHSVSASSPTAPGAPSRGRPFTIRW